MDDIVREWAGRQGQDFRLELVGPAGGTWGAGDSKPMTIDALEFGRILAGRRPATGMLAKGGSALIAGSHCRRWAIPCPRPQPASMKQRSVVDIVAERECVTAETPAADQSDRRHLEQQRRGATSLRRLANTCA